HRRVRPEPLARPGQEDRAEGRRPRRADADRARLLRRSPRPRHLLRPHRPQSHQEYGDRSMTEIIEGELIAAPSSAEMSSWKSRIAALEASDPERAELEITDALTFSNEMLRAVSDVTAQSPSVGANLA